MSDLLKQEFINAGYEVEEPTEGLLVIKDFITKEELDQFLDIINTTPEENWYHHYRNSLAKFCMEKFGRDDVENLVAEGKYEVTQNWDDKNLDINPYDITRDVTRRLNIIVKKFDETLGTSFGVFQRMQAGVELKSHVDQHTDPSIRYAAILYINDDYVDGEVFWTHKNIELRPKPGTLLIFPGTEEFHHGVKHVGKGPIRYVMPAFIKVVGFYENNKY